jgi:lysophospholipase L1-like esterase
MTPVDQTGADAVRVVPAPSSFVALGDSFTEGLSDPSTTQSGRFRGWADRVAEELAAGNPAFQYANLAVRGRKLAAIVAEQVPTALELAPELVSLAGGTNDVLRPTVDLDALSRILDDAVRRLRENGSQVLLFQSIDPTPRSRLIGRTLPRIKALTTLVEEVAETYECVLVPLWGERVFGHPAAWSEDRLHLSAEGHARVAGAVLESLGLGDHQWAEDLGRYEAGTRRERLSADARWARQHLAPWVVRRLRRTSSGDGLPPKLPHLACVEMRRDADGLAATVEGARPQA